MKILVLDNYDSFTYNLVYILRELHGNVSVHRNDKIALEDVADFDKILLSPGPGIPSEAGIMPQLIEQYAASKSIMGVCLGHQAIGEAFGATLHNMADVLHGVGNQVFIKDNTEKLFKGLPTQFEVGRYHSWTVVADSVPETMNITAVDENGQIMALAHKTYDVRGVQFHPESVLTQYGKEMISNWLAE